MENINENMDIIIALAVQYGSKLVLALAILLVGWWLISRMLNLMDKAMDKHGVETTLQRFLLSFCNIGVKALLLIIFASMIGVETTSLIAVMGAAGLAVGLALQGSLSNFAGGVLILFFKPFKSGDVIEAQGFVGIVEEIQIFNTIIKTMDNQRVYIPNGMLSNSCVKNIFVEATHRVDMTFGIGYGDDILHAKKVLHDVMDADSRVLKDPAADIFVAEHADSSVNFVVRPWCKSEDYWPVYFGTIEAVKLAFDREGITIPFPQRDVHYFPQAASK